jgi:hypothetical protein
LLHQVNWRALIGPLAVGLVAPPLLDAVHLLPSLEVARLSVRQGAVSEARLGAGFSWQALRQGLAAQLSDPSNAFIVLLALFGAVTASRLRKGSQAVFYVLIAALYFVLSLGPGSILFAVYRHLPLGSTFRDPPRLLWVTNFAVAVLAGLGSQALLADAARPACARMAEAIAVVLAAALSVYLFATGHLRWIDALLIAGLVALLCSRPMLRFAPIAIVALPALILADTLVAGRPPLFGVRAGDVYGAHRDVFDFLRARLTPQDRVLIVGGQPALALMAKSGTLFAIPNIHDYDPLASQRYAEYFTFMRTGRPMRDHEDWYWIFDKLLPGTLQRPLFDATAARFVVVAERLDATPRAFRGGLQLLRDGDGVRVYENEQALPRARYVARVDVRDEADVLPTLARSDNRDHVVVGTADAAALRSTGSDGTGTAEFVADEPEHVVVRVRASAPGFLFLADEYFPGWTATVNGEPHAIVRANHTFRVVEVPAGESEVVFRYRPLSLGIGAAISVAAILLFVWLWRRAPVSAGAAVAEAA